MVSWFDKDGNIIQWGKQWPFQQMIMKQLDIHMQKNEVGCLPQIIYQMYSKWIKNVKVRATALKLLQ